MDDLAKKILTRNDGQGGAIDDIDDVVTGASNVVRSASSKVQSVASKVQDAAQAVGNKVMGVDSASDNKSWDGSAATAGGAFGFIERKAEAEIAAREQKKQSGSNLFTRFLGTQNSGFNISSEKDKESTGPEF